MGKAALPEDQPRYALVDIHYTTDDGRDQSKLTFVMWSPDDKCGVKDKMLYASSKDAIKKKFTGIMKELQANDMSDLTDDEINALMNKKLFQKIALQFHWKCFNTEQAGCGC